MEHAFEIIQTCKKSRRKHGIGSCRLEFSILGRFGLHLGRFLGGFWELWTLLGALGALLELFLDALGAPSKCEKHFLTLGSLLGRSWEGFGVKFWWFWDGLGLHLGQFGRGFGRDLDALGASWAVLLLLSLAFSSCSCFRLLSLAFSSFLLLAFAFSCFLLFSLAFSCFLLIHRDSYALSVPSLLRFRGGLGRFFRSCGVFFRFFDAS